MRSLSARQAARCETAKQARCACRCGGTLHGAGRFDTLDGPAALDDDDPHHAPPPSPRRPPRQVWIADPLFDLTPEGIPA